MTRDIHKEMTEAANKYAQSITDAAGVQSMLSIAFCEGVRWADNHPKTSTLADAIRKKQIEITHQMEFEDHRCDKTLYGQFQELLRTLGAMSGCSKYIHWSQQVEKQKASFNVYLTIDDEGNVDIDLSLRNHPRE